MRRAFHAAGAIAVLALGLAGCGEDAEPEPGGTPRPSATASASAQDKAEAAKTLPARWWAWAASAPPGRNPVEDRTGEFCGQGQPDDVFFLAGTSRLDPVVRTCTVPAGTPVYFPLVNQICVQETGVPPKRAIAGCRILNRTLLEARVDDQPVVFREASSGSSFDLEPAKGNDLGLLRGDWVAWGVWAGPLKLAPGAHTVQITAETKDLSIDVRYELTVR